MRALFSSSSLSSLSAPSRSALLGLRPWEFEFFLGRPLADVPVPVPVEKAAVDNEVDVPKMGFCTKLAVPVWPRRCEAELEPDAVVDAPEVTETDDKELCRVIVC